MYVGQSYLLSFILLLSLHLHQTTNICYTGIIFLMMIGKGYKSHKWKSKIKVSTGFSEQEYRSNIGGIVCHT